MEQEQEQEQGLELVPEVMLAVKGVVVVHGQWKRNQWPRCVREREKGRECVCVATIPAHVACLQRS